MFKFRFAKGCEPKYMTAHAAGADIVARETCKIAPGERVKIPTGIWIEDIDWGDTPVGFTPEIQIRARSGLAVDKGLILSNGVGTVDADYRDEICVLITNLDQKEQTIAAGDRVAQLVLNYVCRIPEIPIGGKRSGGFGSTDAKR